jgi:hypothetical protein
MRILPTSVIAGVACLALAGSAQAQLSPTTIQPPAGNVPYDATFAVGVQIYKCDGAAWTFVAPRATLHGIVGQKVGDHFAGPTWRWRDGSSVVGAKAGEAPSPIGAIPHLLLKATPTAQGHLFKTSYIQRLATTGGVAPAAGTCTPAKAGELSEIRYTAAYVFWRSVRKER